MKRIQAQRKFAQGAPIPSNNFSSSERRIDVTPIKEETRNVVHNNTPAKTFLDFVSFNQIHEHRVPVVLLERLKTDQTNPFIVSQKNEELEETVEPKNTKSFNFSRDTMCLRSHISIENKSGEGHSELEDHIVNEKVTNVLTKKLEDGTNTKEVKSMNIKEESVETPEPAQSITLNPAMKTLGCNVICNISDTCVDEDMPLAYFAEKKKRLVVNKTKRLTIDRNKKDKIFQKSQLLNCLLQKPSCRGRKKINLDCLKGAQDVSKNLSMFAKTPIVLCEPVVCVPSINQNNGNLPFDASELSNENRKKGTTEEENSNTKNKKTTLSNKKVTFSNQSLEQENTPSDPNFRKKNLRNNRNRVVKKVAVEPSTRRLRNQNGVPDPSDGYQDRNVKLSFNKNTKPVKKTTRTVGKNKKCKKVNQVKNYLNEMCSSSNENEIGNLVSKIVDVALKDIPNAENSPDTSTVTAPRSSQPTDEISPGTSENCTNVSEIVEPSEADDITESCVQCRDMENIIKLQELTEKMCENLTNSSNTYHHNKDALDYGETSNAWKEQYSFDCNVKKKQMLRVKFCTHTKSKKTKPVVACALLSKPSNSENNTETRFPRHMVDYMYEYFDGDKTRQRNAENGTSGTGEDNLNTPGPRTRASNSNASLNVSDNTPSQENNTSSTAHSFIDLNDLNEQSTSEIVIEASEPCSNIEINCKTRSKTNSSVKTNAKRVPLLAPVFTPTAAEFSDPVAYFDSIMPIAKEFGICKVVPPANFVPTCHVNDEMVFNATNQYIARLFSRWGPGSKEMSTIKAYLASQSVVFKRAPLYEGMEVNLPKLYQLVQRHGGLKKVIERKRWSRVAEEMRFTKRPNPEKKLDQLYVKYLLPYDTLSSSERSQIMSNVERVWTKKYRKMVVRAFDPLHRQNKLLSGCESSEEEDEDSDDDEYITGALAEAEECVVPGRKMNLATFKKVATTALDTFFASPSYPTPAEVEEEYWRLVLHGTDHVCVNSASIDTGSAGYGFTKNKSDKYGDHPWNLKMLANNNGNILRFLGQVLGVTVPTLHLGMVFSTSCWHRDPHSLPWMEFMHSGPPKIWYGIPDGQSKQFRKAVESLCPTSCQNKSMWLPSDITMIPPDLLLEHDVSLSRVEQNPGEYIFVFPKAYSSSISTGFTISESVYFASISWLQNGLKCFFEAQISCEPTMISVESLLIAVVTSPRLSFEALLPALSMLSCLLLTELQNRKTIEEEMAAYPRSTRFLKHRPGPWNVREQDECEVCRKTLFISRIRGLTKNNTSLCLEHAIQIIKKKETKNLPVPQFELDYYFYTEEIDNILSTGRKRFHELQAAET